MFKLLFITEKRFNQVVAIAVDKAFTLGYGWGFTKGANEGYLSALKDRLQHEVEDILKGKGV